MKGKIENAIAECFSTSFSKHSVPQSRGVISIENQKFPSALWLDNPKGDFVHSGVVGLGSFDTKKGVNLEIPLGSISLNEDQGILIGSHRECARLYGLAQNYDHITLVDAFWQPGRQLSRIRL